MTIAWTESFYSWTTATGNNGWFDKDVYTDFGIPKGAVLEVICTNDEAGTEVLVGVRTNGSSLARNLAIHESEGGGATIMRQMVKTDANGVIEYYCQVAMSSTYYITGYWTGLDWTETWINLTFVKGDAVDWLDKDVYTSNSIPKGSVCHVIGTNLAAGSAFKVAVRSNGSTRDIAIIPDLTEAESGGVSTRGMFVKTNVSDGIIECYNASYGDVSYYIDGYFDSTMDFVELSGVSITSGGVWTDIAFTATVDEGNRVLDITIATNLTAATNLLGLRRNGSTLDRYITLNEAEDGAYEGLSLTVQTDANKTIEYYSGTGVTWGLYSLLGGYFKFTAGNAQVTKTIYTINKNLSFTLKSWISQNNININIIKSYVFLYILSSIVLISKIVGSIYKIKSNMPKALTYNHKIKNNVSKFVTSINNLRNYVSKITITINKIRNNIIKSISSIYSILSNAAVTLTTVSKYNINNNISKLTNFYYNTISKVTLTLVMLYDILSTIPELGRYIDEIGRLIFSNTLSEIGRKKINSSMDESGKYIKESLFTTITKTISSLFKTGNNIIKQIISLGKLKNNILESLIIGNWKLRTLTSKQSSITYRTSNIISKILPLSFNLRSIVTKILNSLYSIIGLSTFYIKSTTANPYFVHRENSNTVSIRCDWFDQADLSISNYNCTFWLRDSSSQIYGPFTGTVYKESASNYYAIFDLDPDETYSLTLYDVKAEVNKYA